MPEPSLSELYGYHPNADLATGERDVVPDNRQAIQDAIGLAQDNNHAIQQRYALFQKNYADRLKAGQVDYTGVNPNHIPALKEKAANVFSILYRNPSALAGVNVDPKTEAEFAAAKDDLERSVAASKTQYDYAKAQDAFMNHTPELITDENKAVTKKNYTDPLGQFQPRTLNLPSVLDYNTLAKGALDVSKKERPVFEPEYVPKRNEQGQLIPQVVNGQVKLDVNRQPVYEQEYAGRFKSGIVKEADYDSYMKNALSTYDSNQALGKFDQPIQKSVAAAYNSLPESQKMAIEDLSKKAGMDAQRYFYSKVMASKFDKMTDLSGLKEVEDNLYKQKADLRNDLDKMKVKFGYDVYLKNLEDSNKKDFELWKDKHGLLDIDKGGEAINDIVAGTVGQALSSGNKNKYVLTHTNGQPSESGWHKMDVPVSMLTYFQGDAPILDKNGKQQLDNNKKPVFVKSKPVSMLVNEDGTQVRPIFAGAEIDKDGTRIINNVDLSAPITIDQFKQGVAKGMGLEKSLDASNRMLQRMEGIGFPTLNGNVETYIKNRSSGNYNPNKGGGTEVKVSSSKETSGSKMNGKFPEENVTFIDNGVEYNIPSDKVGDFIKAKPNAKKKK